MENLKFKNEKFPLISVIIPVYNVENYIRECLESVICQTYQNLEIILIDDGSQDTSGKICDEYAQKDIRIKVIHKSNGGVSSARNVGLDIAVGDWIYFIDPDDWIELNTLEVVLRKLRTTCTDICFFDYDCVFKEQRTIRKKTINSQKEVFNNLDSLETLCIYSKDRAIWNFMVKSESICGIRFDTNISRGEDTIFKLLLYKNISSFSYLRLNLYHYRKNSNSCTSQISADYPEKVYERYHILLNILQENCYPKNAKIIAGSSTLIGCFPIVVDLAFNSNLNCNYDIIKQYINTNDFKISLVSYNKEIAGKTANIYLLFGKPTRFWITLMYIFKEIIFHLTGKMRE